MADAPVTRTQEVVCVHVGGPWDGAKERRTLRSDQTRAVIAQRVTPLEQGQKPYLMHQYGLRLDGGVAFLDYRGVRISDTPT